MWSTIAEIIVLARNQTWSNVQEISDATMLWRANIEYPKILNKIYFMDKNYWYGSWITDLTIGVNTYSMKEPIESGSPGWPAFGQQDIEKIMVKYRATDTYYNQCRIMDLDNFDKDLSWYELYQPKDDPIAIILDRSFMIYPKPKETVVWGMKLTWPKKPYKLFTWSTAVDNIIPDQYQDILAWALRPYIYRERKLANDEQLAIKEFNDKMLELLYQISIKQTSPVTSEQQDLSQFN